MGKQAQYFWLAGTVGFLTLVLAGCSAVDMSQVTGAQPSAATLATQPATATPARRTATQSATPAASASPQTQGQIPAKRVTFQRGGLTLVGYLYKPQGNGPFPGIIWNHGSEQNPSPNGEFEAIAQIFVPAGYVVFAPEREGQGESQGQYIDDQVKAEFQKSGKQAAAQLLVTLMEGPQLDDQLAGKAYLASLPYVDTNRLAVVGCSYGGIQTLLAAERGAGLKAAVAESPGAESWAGNVPLQQRLIKAVDNIKMPVFLLHPARDVNTLPGYTLGQEFARLGKPYQLEIYGPYGSDTQQGHCFGGPAGFQTWGPEVLRFLDYFDK